MSYFDEKELLEKRGRIIDKQEKLLQEASDEGRELNDDEQKRFDNMEEEYSRLTQQIENTRKVREKKDATEDRLGKKTEELSFKEGKNKKPDEVREEEDLHKRAFWKYVRDGMSELDSEERQFMSQIRAQSSGTGSEGGFTVPEGFSNELETALKRFGGMRQAARVISTDSGNDLPWPTNDDTGNVGEILGENTQVNEQDTTFGVVTFKAWKYSSKAIRVPVELLQDSAFDMESYLAERLAERVGRITNTHFTTGDDSDKPEGVVTGATVGHTTSGGATTFSFEDVIDLKHSVDPAYRNMPSTQFMFSDATLAVIKKLNVDSNDARPLWQPSFVVGEPDRIDGDTYVINQDVDDSGTFGNKFMLYGDFSKYIIRDVRDFQLLVLRERYADFHQVGIFGFLRTDGRMIDAGQNPIQVMQHAAS